MPEYLQHGRRHGPNGSDPIPGLPTAGLPYIHVEKASNSLSSSTSMASVSLSSTFLSWGTDAGDSTASTYFDIQDSGGGTFGIAILQNGLYLVLWHALMNFGPTAPAASSVLQVSFVDQDWDPIVPILSGAYFSAPSFSTILNEGFAPTILVPTAGQNSGSTKTFDFYVTVFRVGEHNTGF